jgi:glutaredoxin-related protein
MLFTFQFLNMRDEKESLENSKGERKRLITQIS